VGHFFLQVVDREAMGCQPDEQTCSNERTWQLAWWSIIRLSQSVFYVIASKSIKPVPGKENIQMLTSCKHP
jgi:hypothetical protein